jgi:hypothetical protein
MNNLFWSLDTTTQITHDIVMSLQTLSPQNQNGTETGERAPSCPVDGLHPDGSKSRSRLDGEFLGSVALFTVD